MVPSADKDERKTNKAIPRKRVLPALPLLPSKPKLEQRELPAESGQGGASIIISFNSDSSRPGSRRDSVTTRSSSTARKASSAPEPASTPASEVSNPPIHPKENEDVPQVDLTNGGEGEIGHVQAANIKLEQSAHNTKFNGHNSKMDDLLAGSQIASTNGLPKPSPRTSEDVDASFENRAGSLPAIAAGGKHVSCRDSQSDPVPIIEGLEIATPSNKSISKPVSVQDDDMADHSVQGIPTYHRGGGDAPELAVTNGEQPQPVLLTNVLAEQPNIIANGPGLPSLFINGLSADASHNVKRVETTTQSIQMPWILHYLNYLYRTKHDCDCHIGLRPIGDGPIRFRPAHGVILSRSPVLRELYWTAKTQQIGNAKVQFVWEPVIAIDDAAFEAVLRYLYIDDLLQLHNGTILTFNGGAHLEKTAVDNARTLMSYGLAGMLLGLSHIEDQGRRLLFEMTNWDVVEHIVQAGLEMRSLGGYSSSSGHVANGLVWYGQQLLDSVFTFISRMWQADLTEFALDVNSPSTLPTYLPRTSDLDTYLRKASLTGLKFGSMPVLEEVHSKPLQFQAVSQILINLPFDDLHQLHTRLKDDVRASTGSYSNINEVFTAILNEREHRRSIVLKSRSVDLESRSIHEAAWSLVSYRESLHNIGGEIQLTREQTDCLIP